MNSQLSGHDRAKELQRVIDELCKLDSVKSNTYIAGELEKISDRINDDIFRIAVVGEFSSGKSTFINALIGKDILSHAKLETTATITYIMNVSANDKRCGTCLVSFRDGTEKALESFDDISSYTTAQSNNNVAERIASVTLYVNFINSDIPLLIVDTPGLNGIAEHHREITINEIKKAHTCIYLLSASGFSNPDRMIIRLLNDYQKNFLFLQNFIDELSKEEGDTPESKISDDDKLIRENILSDKCSFSYKIIGISALKALASKDRSIKKLYSRSIKELTDSDRERLFRESNIAELEEYLQQLMNSGEYKNVIFESASRRLKIIMEGFLGQLDEEQKLNIELREKDEDNERIIAAKKAIEKLERVKSDRENRLRNFVKSETDRQCELLAENVLNELNDIYSVVCDEINEEIKDYSDFENFSSNHGKGISQYFSDHITEMLVDTKKQKKGHLPLMTEVPENTKLFLNHIYENTINRVQQYVKGSVGKSQVRFDIGNFKPEAFKMEETQTLYTISDIKKSIENCNNKIKKMVSERNTYEKMLPDANLKYNEAIANKKAVEVQKQIDLDSLGIQPEVEYYTDYDHPRTVTIEREGLGKILDIFSTKTKTVYDQKKDDSKLRSWNSSRNKILEEYRIKEKEKNSILDAAESERDNINNKISEANNKISKLEKENMFYQEQLSAQEEILKQEVKISKNKHAEREKAKLKASIEDKMLNLSNENSMYSLLLNYIRTQFDRQEPVIEEKGVEALRKAADEQNKRLESMIQSKTDELEKRYSINSAELESVSSLLERLNTIMEGGEK